MAQVEDSSTLFFPKVTPVVRETGEAVVELRQDGQLVGEINFTKIFTSFAQQLGWIPTPDRSLKSVP